MLVCLSVAEFFYCYNNYYKKLRSFISFQEEDKELEVFELLENKINNVSFCSSSSLISKLMEPSIKSTPKKSIIINPVHQRERSNGEKKGHLSRKKIELVACDCGYDDCDEGDCSGDEFNKIFDSSNNGIDEAKAISIKFNDDHRWESDCSDQQHEAPPFVKPFLMLDSVKNPKKMFDNSDGSLRQLDALKDRSVGVGCDLYNGESNFGKDKLKESVVELTKHVDLLKRELKDLVIKKEKHVSEMKNFEREKNKMIKMFEEKKKEIEIIQEEQKKKLLKEKAVFEKHSKSLRGQPKLSQQSQEIKLLKEEVRF